MISVEPKNTVHHKTDYIFKNIKRKKHISETLSNINLFRFVYNPKKSNYLPVNMGIIQKLLRPITRHGKQTQYLALAFCKYILL